MTISFINYVHCTTICSINPHCSITKNKRLHPDRVEYKKYDPVVKKHVIFKETK